ncbi:hypothetical protein Prudu_520S000100, partial [Prunus dulcis]
MLGCWDFEFGSVQRRSDSKPFRQTLYEVDPWLMKLFSDLGGNLRMACKAKLMIPEDEKYEGKPFALSHTRTAITTIKAKFNTQQLQRFEGSCFGHLLLIEDLKWNSQIVHGLLMRKADPKTVTQVNGIKFIVGNKLIQFTAQQFCLITGLRFGKLPFIPKATNENCSLKRKYFSSNKPATLSDLHTAFIECTDDEDALKLGMVYFANFVLLGTEKHVLIDMRYLKLAEDLEEFDKYPWGAVSYAMTNASLLRAVCAEYQRVKVPQKRKMPKQRGKRAQTRMRSGRPREYIIRGLASLFRFGLLKCSQHWKHCISRSMKTIGTSLEYYIGGATRWPVDVQLLRPTDIEKQQPYWSWGDDDNEEEWLNYLGMRPKKKPALLVKKKTRMLRKQPPFPPLLSEYDRNEVEIAKGSVNDVRSLKHQLRSTKDQLAKLRSSNRGLRNRVRDLEAIVQKNCLKHENECDRNKKAIRDLTLKIAEVEHYLKLEMEELKKNYGGEGHEEVCTAQMNEGGQNDCHPLRSRRGCKGSKVPADGVEPFPAMEVIDTEIETSVRERQVDQQPHKVPTSEDVKLPSVEDALLPTPEDGNGYRDWKKTEIEGVGCKVRPPMKCNITLVGDEGDNEATATVRKPDGEGKGCRLKRAATPLLSPFTDPSRKKRKVTDLHAQTPQPRFDPTKPVAMDDVKAIIQLCRAWKTDISAELELEPFEVGADFFYKLLDETAWMSSRHLDMAMFLIRKRQLSHPQLFGREWTTAEFCLQPFAMPSGKRVTRKQSAARTVDPPLTTSKMYTTLSMGHGNMGMRKHGRKCASMLVRFMEPITHTLAKVLHEMRFYEKSEVEAVKRKGTDMSNFNPFTICRISDVPQQSD